MPQDDNDRLKDGTLPTNPEADTEVMAAPGLGQSLASLLTPAAEAMRRRKAGTETPIPLPWATVRTALHGGLWPGLHVLVGNTAAGKTQFALQVALEAAKAKVPVLYVALEAGDTEFVARCLGLLAGESWSSLYHGDYYRLEDTLTTHTPTLASLPLHVLFPSPHGWDYTTLPEATAALRATYPGTGPVLVVLDFLQIVGSPEGKNAELRERIGKAAYVARGVARTHNAAVLVCSSTARENYLTLAGQKKNQAGGTENTKEALGEGNPARFVGAGKEAGEIEFAADTVLVLTAEPWADTAPPKNGTVIHLAVAKIRAGRPQWVELRFNGSRFDEPPADTRTTLAI